MEDQDPDPQAEIAAIMQRFADKGWDLREEGPKGCETYWVAPIADDNSAREKIFELLDGKDIFSEIHVSRNGHPECGLTYDLVRSRLSFPIESGQRIQIVQLEHLPGGGSWTIIASGKAFVLPHPVLHHSLNTLPDIRSVVRATVQ
ncbi:hypothetical protein IID24_00440 [Patescibacteria group bacterium]|nr:hypothetical protein [Patescibacteria group bacterium]